MSVASSEQYNVRSSSHDGVEGHSGLLPRWHASRWSLPAQVSIPPPVPFPPRSSSPQHRQHQQQRQHRQKNHRHHLAPPPSNLSGSHSHSHSHSQSSSLSRSGSRSGSHSRAQSRSAASASASASASATPRGSFFSLDLLPDDLAEYDDASRLVGVTAGAVLGRNRARCCLGGDDGVAVSVVEGSGAEECYTREFRDADTLMAYLRRLQDTWDPDSSMDRTIFIPYGRESPSAAAAAAHGWTLAVDPDSLRTMWETFELPALFASMIFEHRSSHRAGGGHEVLRRSSSGDRELDIFYRYKHTLQSHRSFVFTRLNTRTHASLSVCVNAAPTVRRLWPARARVSARTGLGVHVAMLYAALEERDVEVGEVRAMLLEYEHGRHATSSNPEALITGLHALARRILVLASHTADLESHADRLLRTCAAYREQQRKLASAGGGDDDDGDCGDDDDAGALDFLDQDEALLRGARDRCAAARRWLAGYGDRVYVTLSLAGHAAQWRLGDAATEVARDARLGGTAVVTVAALTAVFLPGTFACALFGMAFFTVSTADGETLRVSSRWWYWLALSVPLTAAVALASWLWFRARSRVVTRTRELEGQAKEA